MGIPVLFKTLLTDYQDIIEPVSSQPIDNLFFDLNCLIHPACASIDTGNENEMIDKIISDINFYISLTNPSFIYIAIDGTAPKAKMIQQQSRRLKSVLENKSWDTNAITPGTKFMNTLNQRLHSSYDSNSSIIISDSSEPGEGEHKILQYMKSHKQMIQKQQNCIYGLDADLIMLSLVSTISNIYLLRERTSFNIEQIEGDYLYMNIDNLKKQILSEFPGIPKQTILNDYIFICFLLGNDFIKASPSLSLRYNGLYHLIDAYKECQAKNFNKFYLINPKTKSLIHWNHFKEFIAYLASHETMYMKEMYDIRLKQHRKYKRIYDNIQKNTTSIVNKSTNSFPVEDIMRHKPVIFMEQEISIFSDFENWVDNYNLFSITGSLKATKHSIQPNITNLCFHYIESLLWTAHYYFDECISYSWGYKYEYSPTLHDLSIYLQTHKRIKINENKQPYSCIEQLYFVLPIQSFHLVEGLEYPHGLQESYYPSKITKEYSLLKRYDWECHPILPQIF